MQFMLQFFERWMFFHSCFFFKRCTTGFDYNQIKTWIKKKHCVNNNRITCIASLLCCYGSLLCFFFSIHTLKIVCCRFQVTFSFTRTSNACAHQISSNTLQNCSNALRREKTHNNKWFCLQNIAHNSWMAVTSGPCTGSHFRRNNWNNTNYCINGHKYSVYLLLLIIYRKLKIKNWFFFQHKKKCVFLFFTFLFNVHSLQLNNK